MLSPEQRQARARIAGLANSAKGSVNTGPATQAAEARFRKQVIAEAQARGETNLPEHEIERRTVAARKLFYQRLAFTSAKARSDRARLRRRGRAA